MNKNELIEQLSSSELSDKQLSAIQNIVNSSELGGGAGESSRYKFAAIDFPKELFGMTLYEMGNNSIAPQSFIWGNIVKYLNQLVPSSNYLSMQFVYNSKLRYIKHSIYTWANNIYASSGSDNKCYIPYLYIQRE